MIEIQDRLTEYLEELQARFHENLPNELKKMARIMVGNEGEPDGFIAPRMSTDFNPNLYISGQESKYWLIEQGAELSTLEVIYTGMRLPHGSKVWSEFGDKTAGIIERDYAMYQETGNDKIAPVGGAKHKYAITIGVYKSGKALRNHAEQYLIDILDGGTGNIPPSMNLVE